MITAEFLDMITMSEGASAIEWASDARPLEVVHDEPVDHCQYCDSTDIASDEYGICVCQDCYDMNIEGCRTMINRRFQAEERDYE